MSNFKASALRLVNLVLLHGQEKKRRKGNRGRCDITGFFETWSFTNKIRYFGMKKPYEFVGIILCDWYIFVYVISNSWLLFKLTQPIYHFRLILVGPPHHSLGTLRIQPQSIRHIQDQIWT